MIYCMQALMGYKSGKGLGKLESGIINPIKESQHKGRRGLGLELKQLDKCNMQWEEEDVSC